MEIVRAKKMGFCFGVAGAINICQSVAKECEDRKFILGMVVHNKNVVSKMRDIGFEMITEEELLSGEDTLRKGDTVVVRAHGTTKAIYDILNKKEVIVKDAACIFVTKIRDILIERESLGEDILFIGDKNHPEVKGIISFGDHVEIFGDLEELKAISLDKNKKYALLTQTTLNKNKLKEVKEYLEKNYSNVNIFDRICGATYERQKSAEELAQVVDLVLIVGDRNSSNSRKLFEISKKYNEKSYLIQDESEIDFSWFDGIKSVGITAGASTPEEIIVNIENKMRGNFNV
ncbi:MAG: 4-hydroxy-3-methylbut-2-enyl diphosphate reductase [Cetobacterium sp.]|uniref:4-hydroxy-3-methylbut-2-enyl diphosphate reductase n=1 Tax=unclassified Cetobacterium TaxID=2630983 RepID=UPI002FC7D676